MDISVLQGTLAAIIVASAIIGILFGVDKRLPTLAGLKGLSKWNAWMALRPVLVETYKEVEVVLENSDMGYEEVETLVFKKIMPLLQASRILTKEQKAVMTEDVVRGLVRPMLKRLYEETRQKKMEQVIKK